MDCEDKEKAKEKSNFSDHLIDVLFDLWNALLPQPFKYHLLFLWRVWWEGVTSRQQLIIKALIKGMDYLQHDIVCCS